MTFTEMFLKAKHWHLFLLTFGIPMIFQVIMTSAMFASIGNAAGPDPSAMFSFFKVFPVLMIIFIGVFFGWFWSIAIGLQYRIPTNVKMKTGMFKVFFFIPLIYMLVISIGIGTVMSGLPGMVEN